MVTKAIPTSLITSFSLDIYYPLASRVEGARAYRPALRRTAGKFNGRCGLIQN